MSEQNLTCPSQPQRLPAPSPRVRTPSSSRHGAPAHSHSYSHSPTLPPQRHPLPTPAGTKYPPIQHAKHKTQPVKTAKPHSHTHAHAHPSTHPHVHTPHARTHARTRPEHSRRKPGPPARCRFPIPGLRSPLRFPGARASGKRGARARACVCGVGVRSGGAGRGCKTTTYLNTPKYDGGEGG
ncbi:hypothetical protein AOQ84DRAFT_411032 [Glonium stellatum]|uniref:Uncharacterized protein n=1 Tax=Glonium stellatum TaxID=574774 RepID=A0A8E2EX00_9PEZI|nr:hypothetical protein AOQ84DRAFT_411032 [Glonium stellatum]